MIPMANYTKRQTRSSTNGPKKPLRPTKPISEEAKSEKIERRRASNRKSQKSFRERKAAARKKQLEAESKSQNVPVDDFSFSASPSTFLCPYWDRLRNFSLLAAVTTIIQPSAIDVQALDDPLTKSRQYDPVDSTSTNQGSRIEVPESIVPLNSELVPMGTSEVKNAALVQTNGLGGAGGEPDIFNILIQSEMQHQPLRHQNELMEREILLVEEVNRNMRLRSLANGLRARWFA